MPYASKDLIIVSALYTFKAPIIRSLGARDRDRGGPSCGPPPPRRSASRPGWEASGFLLRVFLLRGLGFRVVWGFRV